FEDGRQINGVDTQRSQVWQFVGYLVETAEAGDEDLVHHRGHVFLVFLCAIFSQPAVSSDSLRGRSRFGEAAGMLRRGLVVALFLVGNAAPARADIHLSMGLKWNPINYTKPVSASMGGATGPTSVPLSGWQTTSLDNNFGVFFLDGRLGVQL